MDTEDLRVIPDVAAEADPSSEPEPAFALGTQRSHPRIVAGPEGEQAMRQEDISQIVHDLKSPLATIALDVTLLDLRITQAEVVDPRPVLARILRNVDFLDRMVHDLLDTWSPDPSQKMFERTPTDLRALLENVIGRAISTNDRARVLLHAKSTVTLKLDELRIQRVVGNLLSNAIKYAPKKTVIIVRLETFDDSCCVSVIDAGQGVTETEATFIFEKYRRTESARVHDGSGLGLWASRQIIEDHGGSMGVESVPGAGSRFFFELPLR